MAAPQQQPGEFPHKQELFIKEAGLHNMDIHSWRALVGRYWQLVIFAASPEWPGGVRQVRPLLIF